ncbi:MAG: ABC transporter ATP-binding protein [Oscillospiraceae bacterium]|nr:ABC transporter ATP-binding protein [Oscillospiraceae bacterium]
MTRGSSLLWVLKRIRRRIPALLVLTAADAGSAFLGVLFALGTRQVIDSAVSGVRADFLLACGQQGAIILGILLCITVSRHLSDRLRADLDRDWKKDLLHGLLHGDYVAVSRYHSGELINRLNNDVRTVDEGLLGALPRVVSTITRLVSAMAVLLAMEPWFTAALFAAGAAVVIATGLMRRRLKNLHKKVSEQDGKVSGFLQETLEKLLMVQAMDVSAEMEKRAGTLMESRYQLQRRRKNVSLFANTSISVMSYGAGFVALVWCAAGLLQGRMSFGSLTAVTQLVNQLQSPFVGLSGVIPRYIAMTAAAERLMELEAIEGEPEPAAERPGTLYGRMEAICGESLTFAYDRDRVLEGAAFRLPKGGFAAVTGPSGTGKSTLLKLLLGIFSPEGGQLYLDCGGEKVPLDRSTRRLFAYVPQGNLLLSGTLRENLTVTKPDATEAEIAQALHVSAMDEYLPQLPRGLDTVLGESGAGLSEGQAQRLAIARAVLGGAPVLLLDECTSALDAVTEKTVLERLRALPGRSCVAVTHRPAALELCDWNLVMEDGKITVNRK